MRAPRSRPVLLATTAVMLGSLAAGPARAAPSRDELAQARPTTESLDSIDLEADADLYGWRVNLDYAITSRYVAGDAHDQYETSVHLVKDEHERAQYEYALGYDSSSNYDYNCVDGDHVGVTEWVVDEPDVTGAFGIPGESTLKPDQEELAQAWGLPDGDWSFATGFAGGTFPGDLYCDGVKMPPQGNGTTYVPEDSFPLFLPGTVDDLDNLPTGSVIDKTYHRDLTYDDGGTRTIAETVSYHATKVLDGPAELTKTTLVAPSKARAGSRPTITASVRSGSAKPAGSVSVKLQNKKLATLALNNGKATYKLPALKKGKVKLTVSYIGNASYQASSARTTITVRKKN